MTTSCVGFAVRLHLVARLFWQSPLPVDRPEDALGVSTQSDVHRCLSQKVRQPPAAPSPWRTGRPTLPSHTPSWRSPSPVVNHSIFYVSFQSLVPVETLKTYPVEVGHDSCCPSLHLL